MAKPKTQTATSVCWKIIFKTEGLGHPYAFCHYSFKQPVGEDKVRKIAAREKREVVKLIRVKTRKCDTGFAYDYKPQN